MQKPSFFPTESHAGFALLVIRLALAREFLWQGSSILFGAFHGPGIKGFAAFTHLPIGVALLVGLAQFLGGLAILTGVGARVGAAALTVILVGALTFARIPSALATDYAITHLLISIALIISGAGQYSLYPILAQQFRRASRMRRITRAHHRPIAQQPQ
jgi:putative oxidoreductase